MNQKTYKRKKYPSAILIAVIGMVLPLVANALGTLFIGVPFGFVFRASNLTALLFLFGVHLTLAVSPAVYSYIVIKKSSRLYCYLPLLTGYGFIAWAYFSWGVEPMGMFFVPICSAVLSLAGKAVANTIIKLVGRGKATRSTEGAQRE